ncbi:MAG: hypothetical protein AAF211_05725 [Myxococcota bacterium]
MSRGEDELDALMRAEGITPLRSRRAPVSPPPVPAPPAAVDPPPAAPALPPRPSATEPERDPAALDRSTQEIERLRRERDLLQRRLAHSRPSAPAPATAASDLLADCGLTADEGALALARLLEAFGAQALETLQLSDPGPLRRLLTDRLVLTATPDAVGAAQIAVPVTVERCELGSGSDQRVAWHTLVEACAVADVHRLCVVGGSPRYRKALRQLAGSSELALELVPGERPLKRHKVDGFVRRADRVVIWGGTMLAHATSEPFLEAAGAKAIVIGHRGLSGMLEQLADRLLD